MLTQHRWNDLRIDHGEQLRCMQRLERERLRVRRTSHLHVRRHGLHE
jgi:hypothetical protein